MIFSYFRKDFEDLSREYEVSGDVIEVGESFNKKITIWFSSNKPQEKLIEVVLKVRDGPPQPKVKGGGFKPVGKQKIDLSLYCSPSRMNTPNPLDIKMTSLQHPNFNEISLKL